MALYSNTPSHTSVFYIFILYLDNIFKLHSIITHYLLPITNIIYLLVIHYYQGQYVMKTEII